MMYSDRILFLHIPKTGGTSVRHYLWSAFGQPTFYSVIDIIGRGFEMAHRHSTWRQAEAFFRKLGGMDIWEFYRILAVVRNPYGRYVSMYHFVRQDQEHIPSEIWRAATENDFPGFVKNAPMMRPQSEFVLTDLGLIPSNLRILHYEDLEAELRVAALDATVSEEEAEGVRKASLRRMRTSSHDAFAGYFTPEAEETVYEREKWLFDNGFYERLKVQQ